MIYTIESAVSADVDTLADFNIALAAESEELALDPATVRAGVQAMLNDDAKGRYYVARVNGDGTADGSVQQDNGHRPAVGQLAIMTEWSDWRNAPIWWIQSVYVHPDHRRQGVFRALYEHILDAAAREDVPIVRLYVEGDNHNAQATYASLGLDPSGYHILERFLKGKESRPSTRHQAH